jgi:RecA/RadA recombinase
MLDPDTRGRHLHVVGQTSTGKSTLLLNLIAQDLAAGQGLAVLDLHGDLAETVLLHVPRNLSNVIMPCQRARHIGQLNRRECYVFGLMP